MAEDPAVRRELLAVVEAVRDQFQNLQLHESEWSFPPGDLAKFTDGIVVDVDEWSDQLSAKIVDLRDRGYRGPVLVLASREPGSEPLTGRAFDKVAFLNKPYGNQEFVGLIRRMLIARIIAARKFPRHETNEDAQIQIEDHTLFYGCKVKNMSKGGAYVDLGRALHLRIGDAVILKIRLGTVKKEYALRARVAWMNPKQSGFGIEFVNALK